MDEMIIIELMAKGLNQKEISVSLQSNGFPGCSVSSIEKKLKAIRKKHDARTNFELALKLKDENLI